MEKVIEQIGGWFASMALYLPLIAAVSAVLMFFSRV